MSSTVHGRAAARSSPTSTASQVSAAAAHEELLAALLAADEATLRRLVSEECRIIGPKGFRLSAEEWIHAHVADVYELRSVDQLQTHVQQLGPAAAVVLARQDSVCFFRGERIDGLFQVIGVWHRVEDFASWQLVALQYTAVSDAAR